MSQTIMLCMLLFYFLVSSAYKASTPGFVSNVVGLYTHRSYSCSADLSFNQGLTFNVYDFVHAGASTPSMMCTDAFKLLQLISSHAFLKPFHHNMHA
jgi:hypothetical protein